MEVPHTVGAVVGGRQPVGPTSAAPRDGRLQRRRRRQRADGPIPDDLFAGPGGRSEALTVLGVRDIGLEWDEWACKSRAAASQLTIRTDVALYFGAIALIEPPIRPWKPQHSSRAPQSAHGALYLTDSKTGSSIPPLLNRHDVMCSAAWHSVWGACRGMSLPLPRVATTAFRRRFTPWRYQQIVIKAAVRAVAAAALALLPLTAAAPAHSVVRRHPTTEPPQKPVGGPRRPLLPSGRPCERTRRWYP